MANRIWIGLLFLLFGVGFLLHQADLLDFSAILSTWWPLIIIVIGIVQLMYRTNGSYISGFLFLLVGGVLLVNQWVDINLHTYIWPLLFIFIGIVILFYRSNRDKSIDENQDINSFVLFSGEEVRNQSTEFRGGSITAIFGGSEIDLRDAVIAEEGALIDITTVFGGVSIIVPENVQIEASGVPVFGGWEDNTRSKRDNAENVRILKLNYFVVFGGIEIKD